MKKTLNILRGVISIILYLFNMLIVSTLLLFCAAFIYLLPNRKWRHRGVEYLHFFPWLWTAINGWIMNISTHGKWDIQGQNKLNRRGTYVLISNHRSWFDILVLSIVFNNKIPILKFFMKKELLWTLPLGGLGSYALGYPFLERHTQAQIKKNPKLKGKDIITTRKACHKFKEFPTTIMIFLEGTRFSERKKQGKRSPFQHLLKPKAGGMAIVFEELYNHIDQIINATIHYKTKHLSFWNFACGNVDKITIRYETMPLEKHLVGNYYEDREFRIHFQEWLNNVWQKKDELLENLEKEELAK